MPSSHEIVGSICAYAWSNYYVSSLDWRTGRQSQRSTIRADVDAYAFFVAKSDLASSQVIRRTSRFTLPLEDIECEKRFRQYAAIVTSELCFAAISAHALRGIAEGGQPWRDIVIRTWSRHWCSFASWRWKWPPSWSMITVLDCSARAISAGDACVLASSCFKFGAHLAADSSWSPYEGRDRLKSSNGLVSRSSQWKLEVDWMIRDLPSSRQPVMSKVELDDSTFVTTNVSVGVHSAA